jgi:hypothetical protein
VSAQVELDVACPDHETVAGTVQEIVLYVRVVRDHLTTRDVLGKRRARADRKEGRDGRRENAEPNQQP